MGGVVLTEADRAVLLDAGRRRIVCSLFPPEDPPIDDTAHAAWMRRHVDRHPAREVLIALRGDGRLGFQGAVWPCRPGSVFLFDAFEEHDRYYPPFAPDMLHVWLHFLGRDAVAHVAQVSGGRTRMLSAWIVFDDDPAMALLDAWWVEAAHPGDVARSYAREKLRTALQAAMVRIAERSVAGAVEGGDESSAARIVRGIRGLVDETAGRGFTLAHAARLAGYSAFHFHRIFERETGRTFHAYVDAIRVAAARRLLRGRSTRKEIADALGFSHPSSLLRWMKARGISATTDRGAAARGHTATRRRA